MQEREGLNPADEEVEHLLTKLSPTAPPRLRAVHILFEAQRRRDRHQLWAWRGIAAVLALSLAIQFSMKSAKPTATSPGGQRPTVESISFAKRAIRSLPPDLETLSGDGYIATRNRSLAFGVSSIAAQAPSPAPSLPIMRSRDFSAPHTPSFFQLLSGSDAEVRS